MISRPLSGRPASANPVPFDLMRASLVVFGPGLLITITVTAVWLVSVWQ